MRIAMLGSGVVGRTLGTKLVEAGHDVRMGSRDAANADATAWAEAAGERASNGTFADAVEFADLIVNATAGSASRAALGSVEADQLVGKVLVDVANPLDFSGGMPPTLSVANTDSLAERLQREWRDTRVVKALNTVTADVMVDPGRVPGHHTVFIAGDDDEAKAEVRGLLHDLGWPDEDILDLGGIEAARGLEMYLALWLRIMGAVGTPYFNVEVKRA